MMWQSIALQEKTLIFNWMELLHFVENCACSHMNLGLGVCFAWLFISNGL
jgi:hypothetical protein